MIFSPSSRANDSIASMAPADWAIFQASADEVPVRGIRNGKPVGETRRLTALGS